MTPAFSNATEHVSKLTAIDNQVTKGDLVGAVAALNKLAKTSANDPRLFILGAKVAEASGNPLGVLTAARRAFELAPDWPTASLLLAGVLASQAEADAAIPLLEKSIENADLQSSATVELFRRAALLARKLRRVDLAQQWLLRAQVLDTNDLDLTYQLALTDIDLHLHSSAIERLNLILQLEPANTSALRARMEAYFGAGQIEMALTDGNKALSLDASKQEEILFLMSIGQGQTPERQPKSVIEATFGSGADVFDKHMIVNLDYKLPQKVADIILDLYPEKDCDILDLGCGTGLLGACLGPMVGAVVGVDLSQTMIDKAVAHRVYDRFHRVDIADALQATPAEEYQLITAVDALNYFGALHEVIKNAARILVPGGRFIFSCEAAQPPGPDYVLSAAFRYSHQKTYIERLLNDAGFASFTAPDVTLRTEAGQPVVGFLVVAVKAEKKVRKKRTTTAKDK